MREDVARMKIDPSVKRETLRVAGGICVLSGLMLFVFIVLDKLDMTVIFGTLLGTFNAILNFFLLAISVQKAADSMQGVVLPPEEDEENGNEKRMCVIRHIRFLVGTPIPALRATFSLRLKVNCAKHKRSWPGPRCSSQLSICSRFASANASCSRQ